MTTTTRTTNNYVQLLVGMAYTLEYSKRLGKVIHVEMSKTNKSKRSYKS